MLVPWWGWSWDTIPRWASGQGATDFTSDVTSYYTKNFDVMWMQGTRCCWTGDDKLGYKTWEEGLVSDAKKIHAVRPTMPTFAYYGWYGCCSPYNNEWFSKFNATNASALWLRDDQGKPVQLGGGSSVGYAYDFCHPVPCPQLLRLNYL